MSEEEKQAIEKFSNLMTKHFEDKKIDTSDYLDYLEAITILNLIEKQQKEIEYLKSQIPQDKIFYYSEKDYISKDKIKEKIEEYKNRKNNTSVIFFRKYGKTQDTFKQAVYTEIIGFLKDLLGE